MAKKKRKRTVPRSGTTADRTSRVVEHGDAITVDDVAVAEAAAVEERLAFEAAQRAAVRRTTTGIVLFCILVGLATAAIMLAGGGSGQ